MIDYHVHSTHSGDAVSTMAEHCQRAVELGFTEIGFADHLDFDPTDPCYRHLVYDAFMRDIDRVRREFGSDLTIRTGIEVDYRVQFHEIISHWLSGKSFDYIIGSAHYVDGILLECHNRYFPGRTAQEAYLPYFQVTESVIRSGLFDVLAHFDLCKRHGSRYFGPFDFRAFYDRTAEILRLLIDSRMALEINTSGLRQQPLDTYPSLDMIRLYLELGGEYITVGSDAHKASDLGYGVCGTLEKLRSLGITRLTTFCERKHVKP